MFNKDLLLLASMGIAATGLVGNFSWSVVALSALCLCVWFSLAWTEGTSQQKHNRKVDLHIRNKRKYGWRKAWEMLKEEDDNGKA